MKDQNLNPVDFVYEITEPIESVSFVKGNRKTSSEHIRSIKRAMQLGVFIPAIYIDSATNQIVDGQHRYQAACELWNEGKKVSLLVIFHHYGNTLGAAIDYNNNSKNWRAPEYIAAFIEQGRTPYILLQRFCETHKLLKEGNKYQYAAASDILTGGHDHLKDGLLRITEESLLLAETVYHELELMAELTGCPYIIKRGYVLAWMKVRLTVLAKMTLIEWVSKLQNLFSMPMSDKREDWVNEYLRVALA